jgi:hypothetical protein
MKNDHVFLVAAVALPVAVVALFLLASAVPRWRVAAPRYDFVFSASTRADTPAGAVPVAFHVRDGRVEADVQALSRRRTNPPGVALYVFDHDTLDVREIPVEVPPDLSPDDPPRRVVVDALAGRRAIGSGRAPDGYQFQVRTQGSPGLVGELFGMGRYGQGLVLANEGRLVRIDLPESVYVYNAAAVGWLDDDGTP